MYLAEAFKALNALNEDTFSLSDDGIKKLSDFEQNDDLTDEISVIDPEAETEDDLQDSYVGKVILDCSVCHSKLYKDKSEVTVDEEQQLANVGEECPYCYTSDGFKVIGEVAAFNDESKEESEEESEEETNTEKPEENESEELEEGLFSKKKKKPDFYSKEEIEKRRKQHEAEYQRKKEEREEAERKRGAEVAASWKRYEDSERNAKRDYERSRYNSIKGDKPSNTGYRGVNYSGGDYYESLEESVNNVNVETDDSIVNVETDEAGKVVVSTEPKTNLEGGDEMLAPLDPETETEILNNDSEDIPVDDEVEMDIDEFDEESFDELGESYLRNIYENVNSYKTTKVSTKDSKLKVEGVIKFNSGNEKKTSFIFESKDVVNKTVRFVGENLNITRGKKAFTVKGKIDEGKFISESLNYNYKAKDDSGKSTRIYGTVKTKGVK